MGTQRENVRVESQFIRINLPTSGSSLWIISFSSTPRHFFLVSAFCGGSGMFASNPDAGINGGGGGRFETLVGCLIFKLLRRREAGLNGRHVSTDVGAPLGIGGS